MFLQGRKRREQLAVTSKLPAAQVIPIYDTGYTQNQQPPMG